MTNNIELQKLKEEYPEFFKQVSPKLLEFILSEETSSKIAEICLENGVEDEEKIEKIAYRITLALLGQVPKENLTEILEKGVRLDHEIAKKISIEIQVFIFPRIQETQPKKIRREEDQIKKDDLIQPTESLPPVVEEEPKQSPKEDTYREPIE